MIRSASVVSYTEDSVDYGSYKPLITSRNHTSRNHSVTPYQDIYKREDSFSAELSSITTPADLERNMSFGDLNQQVNKLTNVHLGFVKKFVPDFATPTKGN